MLAGLLLITALSPAASAEEALGRLFFTPEYRQNLDRQRQMNVQNVQQATDDPTLTINGMVTRSSGKRTAWVNGIAQSEREMRGGFSVTPSRKESGKVVIQGTESPTAKTKVGDTINRNTGESTGLLNGGRINIGRTAP